MRGTNMRTAQFGATHLADRLTEWAAGVPAVEAAVGLLIEHEFWLRRPPFVIACIELLDYGDPPMAWIDWDRVAAFNAPAAREEHAIRLIAVELAGSPAGGGLAPLLASLDPRRLALALDAIAHAAGWHDQNVAHIVTGSIGLRP
jgi:hypothetical protein